MVFIVENFLGGFGSHLLLSMEGQILGYREVGLLSAVDFMGGYVIYLLDTLPDTGIIVLRCKELGRKAISETKLHFKGTIYWWRRVFSLIVSYWASNLFF